MAKAVKASELKAWLSDGGEIALFDVREIGPYSEGHPFFAVPLAYSRLELEIEKLAPRKSVRMVLFDGGGAFLRTKVPHAVHFIMFGKRFCECVARASDDVHHAVRQIRRFEYLIEIGGGKRIQLTGDHDSGVTHRDHRRDQ